MSLCVCVCLVNYFSVIRKIDFILVFIARMFGCLEQEQQEWEIKDVFEQSFPEITRVTFGSVRGLGEILISLVSSASVMLLRSDRVQSCEGNVDEKLLHNINSQQQEFSCSCVNQIYVTFIYIWQDTIQQPRSCFLYCVCITKQSYCNILIFKCTFWLNAIF